MKKFLLIATLSVITGICRSEEYPVPPQFKVWGTTVPDDSENIAVPATLEEVLPSGGIVFFPKDMGAAGFYPFRINCCDKLHYTRTPSSAELSSPGVKKILAQGEYEPALVGIYAAKSINLKATLSKISKADGTEFPASCLDLRWIRQTPYPYARGLWSMEPLILEKKIEKNVSAGQSIYLWLTAFAPDKLPAGIYEGNILLTADGLPQQQVSVKFRVLPFSLPQTPFQNANPAGHR